MTRKIFMVCVVVIAFAVGAAAEDNEKENQAKPPGIIGTWMSIDRHIALGSLFQPVHGVRKRESRVFFEQEGEKIKGHAVMADHAQITNQERWKDGRTDFRKVSFADSKLAFEFDIAEWRITAAPIAVEERKIENKGTIRVEAKLAGDRLTGKWGMFTADGVEVFRGEWEAERAKKADDAVPQDKPKQDESTEPRPRSNSDYRRRPRASWGVALAARFEDCHHRRQRRRPGALSGALHPDGPRRSPHQSYGSRGEQDEAAIAKADRPRRAWAKLSAFFLRETDP